MFEAELDRLGSPTPFRDGATPYLSRRKRDKLSERGG
jgi:hypothetical protein